MTDIVKLLDKEMLDDFKAQTYAQIPTIEGDDKVFKMKVAELNATNFLLVIVEHELRTKKIEKEDTILNLKNSEEYVSKYKTLKQREELALMEVDDISYEILELQRKQQILRANKEGLEYELRMYR